MDPLSRRLRAGYALLGALCLGRAAAAEDFRVLVFTKTAGYVHASIPEGVALVEALGTANGFGVDATDDAAAFETSNLAQYAAVVWLSTTGDVLDAAQEAAFEDFVRAGGGYVGVHSASGTEEAWPWYGGLLGNDARFAQHPAQQSATLAVVNATHRSTRGLPASFQLFDEWYDFENDPTPAVHVLLTVDEGSYAGAQMGLGADHPISWFHHYDGGRAWYTSLGHDTHTLSNPGFAEHLLGGILWAAGGTEPPKQGLPALPWPASVTLAVGLVLAGSALAHRARGVSRKPRRAAG